MKKFGGTRGRHDTSTDSTTGMDSFNGSFLRFTTRDATPSLQLHGDQQRPASARADGRSGTHKALDDKQFPTASATSTRPRTPHLPGPGWNCARAKDRKRAKTSVSLIFTRPQGRLARVECRGILSGNIVPKEMRKWGGRSPPAPASARSPKRQMLSKTTRMARPSEKASRKTSQGQGRPGKPCGRLREPQRVRPRIWYECARHGSLHSRARVARPEGFKGFESFSSQPVI